MQTLFGRTRKPPQISLSFFDIHRVSSFHTDIIQLSQPDFKPLLVLLLEIDLTDSQNGSINANLSLRPHFR
jgi:hypothetical protein